MTGVMRVIVIDGVEYKCKCDVTRGAEMSASSISGLMLDKSYFNDVLGTYLQYDVTMTFPMYNQAKYWRLFDTLSDPYDAHSFVLPWNGSTVTVTGRVESVSDVQVEMDSGRTYWQGLKFSVIANHPTKTLGLADVLERGLTPLPDVMYPNEGDTYTFKNGNWVLSGSYRDADLVRY